MPYLDPMIRVRDLNHITTLIQSHKKTPSRGNFEGRNHQRSLILRELKGPVGRRGLAKVLLYPVYHSFLKAYSGLALLQRAGRVGTRMVISLIEIHMQKPKVGEKAVKAGSKTLTFSSQRPLQQA